MKHVLVSKNARIFGIKAEHQTHTKLVKGFLRFQIIRVFVLGKNLVIQHTNNLTRLDADFQLPLDMGIGIIHQESQTVIFLFQIGQMNHFRRVIGMLHVMHLKGSEVAGDNPSGSHRQRQTSGIATRLLIWREFRSITLLSLGCKVDMRAFLLN